MVDLNWRFFTRIFFSIFFYIVGGHAQQHTPPFGEPPSKFAYEIKSNRKGRQKKG